jgi:hypothetical protein
LSTNTIHVFTDPQSHKKMCGLGMWTKHSRLAPQTDRLGIPAERGHERRLSTVAQALARDRGNSILFVLWGVRIGPDWHRVAAMGVGLTLQVGNMAEDIDMPWSAQHELRILGAASAQLVLRAPSLLGFQ